MTLTRITVLTAFAAAALALGIAASPLFAQMQKNDGMMKNDSMQKSDGMKNDAMQKNDGMKNDAMQKNDGMKNDAPGQKR